MSDKDDGGPAFPNVDSEDSVGVFTGDKGMSLRDYFAIHSLAEARCQVVLDKKVVATPENIAAAAYEIADAMLTARAL